MAESELDTKPQIVNETVRNWFLGIFNCFEFYRAHRLLKFLLYTVFTCKIRIVMIIIIISNDNNNNNNNNNDNNNNDEDDGDGDGNDDENNGDQDRVKRRTSVY